MAEKKLRIAMMGHKHMLSREGGIEIVVRELSTRMAAQGHEVTCYDRHTRHVSGDKLDCQSEFKGVRIKSVWTIDKKGLAAMTSSLSAALRSAFGRYDVVHIHAEGPAVMCWIPHLFHKRVIVTVHGLDWARKKWGSLAAKYIKLGEKEAVKRANEIIVLSHKAQEYFLETYNRQTVFIPNGVNRPSLQKSNEINEIWGLEKDSYVLFVGRIVPEKGLEYLIEAWKDLYTSKKLVVVGGSSDSDAYVNEIKLRAPETVVFTGFQQGIVLDELFSNCYFFCLPSDLEGMPLSLLEAMSYGNCCVVSDIAECLEVVGDRAVVFPKGDVIELRRVLQELLDYPERVAKYRNGAADYITEKYNWDSVVKETLDLYQDCENKD